MKELSLSQLELVGGGNPIEDFFKTSIGDRVVGAVAGAVEGIPLGILFGGKYGGSGGFVAGGVGQLIGCIWGGISGFIGFGVTGFFYGIDKIGQRIDEFRSVVLAPGVSG